jgi:hypothetical protein
LPGSVVVGGASTDIGREVASIGGPRAPPPVSSYVAHALTVGRPQARSVVGADARGQAPIEPLPAVAREGLLRLAFGI